MAIVQVSKAEFARLLGISRARVTQYSNMGMPVLSDGTLDLVAARDWVKTSVSLYGNRWIDRGAFAMARARAKRRMAR